MNIYIVEVEMKADVIELIVWQKGKQIGESSLKKQQNWLFRHLIVKSA